MIRSATRTGTALLALPLLAACEGPQSALDPAGKDATVLADLFWVLLAGALVLWFLINGLFFYVTRLETRRLSRRLAETLIIGGGIVFPVVVLAGLLAYGLALMPEQRAAGEGLTVRVTAERWWWRVEYWPEGADAPIVAANEVRLPVDRRTEIKLGAAAVIHSFWIPALGGKMDMFPGRETRLALEPQKPGIYRGQCAEFCGASHALMAFQAVAMQPAAFEDWLRRESRPAAEPSDDLAQRGRAVFLAEGCGACHTVRGTAAKGRTGPDLTHVGGRESLGAGILPPTVEAFARWIRHAGAIKPEVGMPSYRDLDEAELRALGHYLEGLI